MRSAAQFIFFSLVLFGTACKKGGGNPDPSPNPNPTSFSFASLKVNGTFNGFTYYNVNFIPVIKFSFTSKVNLQSVAASVSFRDKGGTTVPYNSSLENGDSTLIIQPSAALTAITRYNVNIGTNLISQQGRNLLSAVELTLTTQIDSTDKFPVITDNALLTLVQQQTFKYFWDFAHPVSGLTRERNTSGETVTSGGSGFGIMAIPVAINRSFITRAQGLARMQTIVGFLKNTAQRFHGAFPHWLNGTNGTVIPFSPNDNGADLVETSYLMQGLICARQYFDGANAAETTLRNDINTIWNGVEWSWFRQNNQNKLYWHWSPNLNWVMNFPISGWNECLITYVMAASSTTFPIPKIVYDNGWAGNGAMVNNNNYYGYQLPLGPAYGGPLFLAHYSFLGINPNQLTDPYANYQTQTKNHTLINYSYCVANPQGNFGYSNLCWGLTASDIENDYTASSPTNDRGFIAPTAAISSMPYTPTESMNALKFFYYKLGDKIWSNYGFVDAFSLKDTWFATSTLAIDQGPIILMIENYRTGLLWNLFTSAPEVKQGMRDLGFVAPYL
ncbi:hypothetical protein BH11BAC4_BH11BAC4_08560 [soil metagenome]